MPDRNQNRDLAAEQVVHLFQKQLPHMFDGLGADREWLWWSGPKPKEDDRKILVEIGFSFTPVSHTLDDGRPAHWYHSCGGAVFRRKRSSRQQLTPRPHGQKTRRVPATENSAAQENLERLADLLPTSE